MSRIHVPLFFSDLSDEDRTTIWNNNFFRLQEQNPDIKVNKFAQLYIEKDPTLKALKWNGREIRNGESDTRAMRYRFTII